MLSVGKEGLSARAASRTAQMWTASETGLVTRVGCRHWMQLTEEAGRQQVK